MPPQNSPESVLDRGYDLHRSATPSSTMPQAGTRGPGRPPGVAAAETRKRIVSAARDVFGDQGYEAATFRAIAVCAGLTRPAISHYFTTKWQLYREVLEQANADTVMAGVEKAATETGLIEQLSAFFAATIQIESEDRSAVRFLVTSMLEAQRHPDLNSAEHDSISNTRSFLTTAVGDAIARGELTADTEVAPLVGMLVGVLGGMGLYCGFLGAGRQAVTDQLRRLLAGNLVHLT